MDIAFSEAIIADPAWATPRVRELHELLRLCKFDAIAPWLEHERAAEARPLAFAERIGDHKVSSILRDALAGKTRGDVTFSVTLADGETRTLDVDGGETTRLHGHNWGGTDIALSFAMDDFTLAVVHEVVAATDAFELEPPQAERKETLAPRAATDRAQQASAARLFELLVTARQPRLEVGDWDAFEARRMDGNTLIAITHEANPPAAAETLAAMAGQFGDAARDLLSLYAQHDGAALFQHDDTCGFCFAAIDWAENVTWQDDRAEIPSYLYSAIAFGMIPGDSEVWLLVTEGEHAGKIMLSDTDLMDERARFESITAFLAILLEDAARVINCGGLVRYEVDGRERFAVRYSSGGAGD